MVPSVNTHTLASSRSHGHLNETERGSHKERARCSAPNLYSQYFFELSPKVPEGIHQCEFVLGRRKLSHFSGITGHCLRADTNFRRLKMPLWSTTGRGAYECQVMHGV